jgi:outer membrane receptor for ferrienterochelin and colicins
MTRSFLTLLIFALAVLPIADLCAQQSTSKNQTGDDDDSAHEAGDDDDSAHEAGDDDDSAQESGDDDDSAQESGDDDDSAAPDEQSQQKIQATPQENPSVPHLIVEEEIVVTATGEERVLSESPVPVLLIRSQDLREHGASDLGEALRRAPGLALDVSNFSDQFGGSGISLSGAEPRHTLVLIDGRPVAGDSAGVVDLGQIPADMIERVEIVEGPMSALYGSDAIGGVLNIITKGAADGASIGGHSSYGSLHKQTHGIEGTAGNGEVGGRFNINYQYFDGAADERWLKWTTSDPGPYARYLVPPSHQIGGQGSFDISKGRFRLGLSALANHQQTRAESADLYPEPVGTLLYSDPRSQTRFVGNARVAFQLSRVRFVDLDIGGTLFRSSSEHEQQNGPDFRRRNALDHLFQMRLRAALDIEELLLLQGGVELYRQDLNVESQRYAGAGLEPELIAELPARTVHRVEPYLHIDWFATSWLELLAGFRGAIHQTFGFQAIPSLSLNFKPWRFTRIRLSAGRGYRAPDLKELYYEFDHSHLGYMVLGNEELEAERSWGTNLSIEQRRLGGALTVRLGGFLNYFEELIELRLDPSASEAGLVVYRYNNLGRALTVGGQLFMLLDLRYLEASGTYRYLFSRDLERGSELISRPQHSGSISVVGKIPKIKLRFGASLSGKSSYLSEVPNLQGTGLVSELQTTLSAPIINLGAHISWKPIPALEIHANFSNLLDQKREPGDYDRLEAPLGRTVSVGVRMQFDKPKQPSEDKSDES